MLTTEIGKTYRDTVTGVVGAASGQQRDEEEPKVERRALTQLRLNPEHLGDQAPGDDTPKGHDMRWYPNDRLEPVE